jgi:hypothetical protein
VGSFLLFRRRALVAGILLLLLFSFLLAGPGFHRRCRIRCEPGLTVKARERRGLAWRERLAAAAQEVDDALLRSEVRHGDLRVGLGAIRRRDLIAPNARRIALPLWLDVHAEFTAKR